MSAQSSPVAPFPELPELICDNSDNLKSMAGSLALPFSNAITNKTLPQLNKLVQGVDISRFVSAFETMAQSASDTFTRLTNKLAQALDSGNFKPFFDEIGAMIGGLAAKFAAALPDILNTLVSMIQQAAIALAQGIGDAVPILKPFTAAIEFLASNLQLILAIIVPLTAAFIAFRAAMAVKQLIDGVTTAMAALNVAMTANPVGVVVAGIATREIDAGTPDNYHGPVYGNGVWMYAATTGASGTWNYYYSENTPDAFSMSATGWKSVFSNGLPKFINGKWTGSKGGTGSCTVYDNDGDPRNAFTPHVIQGYNSINLKNYNNGVWFGAGSRSDGGTAYLMYSNSLTGGWKHYLGTEFVNVSPDIFNDVNNARFAFTASVSGAYKLLSLPLDEIQIPAKNAGAMYSYMLARHYP